jgi:hypothetical protein
MDDFLVASRIVSRFCRETMGKGIGINESSHGKKKGQPVG